MKAKISLLLSVFVITAVIVVLVFLPRNSSVEQEEAMSRDLEASMAVTVMVEDAVIPSEEVQEEGLIDSAENEDVPLAVTTANCDHNIPCFIAAVTIKQNAHYWGESSKELLPGVTTWVSRIWDFYVTPAGTAYTFTSTINDAEVNFADGWFATYLASDAFPAEMRKQIEDAEYLTEEELDGMDSETRASYEQQIASGKSPQDMAKELAAYSVEHYVRTSVMGAAHTTQTCSLDDVASLVVMLKNWEQGVFASDDLNFADCQTSYQP